MGCATSAPDDTTKQQHSQHQSPLPPDASSASPASPPAIQFARGSRTNVQPAPTTHPAARDSVRNDESPPPDTSRNAASSLMSRRVASAASLGTTRMAFTPLQQRFGATEGATGDMTAPLFFYARRQRAPNDNDDGTAAPSPRVRVVAPSPSRDVGTPPRNLPAPAPVVVDGQPRRRESLLTPRALAQHASSPRRLDQGERSTELPSPTTPAPSMTDAIRAWQEDVQRTFAEDASFTTDGECGIGA